LADTATIKRWCMFRSSTNLAATYDDLFTILPWPSCGINGQTSKGFDSFPGLIGLMAIISQRNSIFALWDWNVALCSNWFVANCPTNACWNYPGEVEDVLFQRLFRKYKFGNRSNGQHVVLLQTILIHG
jgi:hypothetical protein